MWAGLSGYLSRLMSDPNQIINVWITSLMDSKTFEPFYEATATKVSNPNLWMPTCKDTTLSVSGTNPPPQKKPNILRRISLIYPNVSLNYNGRGKLSAIVAHRWQNRQTDPSLFFQYTEHPYI